tara:strand:+ start:2974 stop:3234 length:261 start_codon:yes stop_codon:yes gene_type:complete
MIFKVLGNSVALNNATNVGSSTLVRIVNTDTAEQTVTVANTVSKLSGGGDAGTFVLEGQKEAFLAKKSTDTVVSVAAVKASPVARA